MRIDHVWRRPLCHTHRRRPWVGEGERFLSSNLGRFGVTSGGLSRSKSAIPCRRAGRSRKCRVVRATPYRPLRCRSVQSSGKFKNPCVATPPESSHQVMSMQLAKNIDEAPHRVFGTLPLFFEQLSKKREMGRTRRGQRDSTELNDGSTRTLGKQCVGSSKTARPSSYVTMRVLSAARCSWSWPAACSKACGAKLPSIVRAMGTTMEKERASCRGVSLATCSLWSSWWSKPFSFSGKNPAASGGEFCLGGTFRSILRARGGPPAAVSRVADGGRLGGEVLREDGGAGPVSVGGAQARRRETRFTGLASGEQRNHGTSWARTPCVFKATLASRLEGRRFHREEHARISHFWLD